MGFCLDAIEKSKPRAKVVIFVKCTRLNILKEIHRVGRSNRFV